MEDNDYVLAFDHFYTTNHIQILKSLLPFMNKESARLLPAVIKYMELKHTLSMLQRGDTPTFGDDIHACSDEAGISKGIEKIYGAVRPYLSPDEDKMLSQLTSAIQTMKNMQEIQQMMEMMQSLNPDGFADFSDSNAFGGLDISEIINLFNEFGKSED